MFVINEPETDHFHCDCKGDGDADDVAQEVSRAETDQSQWHNQVDDGQRGGHPLGQPLYRLFISLHLSCTQNGSTIEDRPHCLLAKVQQTAQTDEWVEET